MSKEEFAVGDRVEFTDFQMAGHTGTIITPGKRYWYMVWQKLYAVKLDNPGPLGGGIWKAGKRDLRLIPASATPRSAQSADPVR